MNLIYKITRVSPERYPDDLVLTNAKLMVNSSLLATFFAFAYMVLFYFVYNPSSIISLMVSVPFLFAPVLILRASQLSTIPLAASISSSLGAFIAIGGCIYTTGGIQGAVVIWACAIPLITTLQSGAVQGVIWTSITVLGSILLGVFDGYPGSVMRPEIRLPFPPGSGAYTIFQVCEMAGAVSFAGFLGIIFDILKNGAFRNFISVQKQLDENFREVQSLLNNLRQAVIVIDPDKKIITPISQFASEIFEGQLVGESVYNTVFRSLSKDSESYGHLSSILNTAFGEDSLQWDLIEGSLPRKIIYKRENQDLSHFKITYCPLWNTSGVLGRIMLVIEDITEVLKLEEKLSSQSAVNNLKVQILQELIAVPRGDLFTFIQKSAQGIKQMMKPLILKNDIRKEELNELLRNLHTLKGNSRTLRLLYLASAVHETESECIVLKNQIIQNSVGSQSFTHLAVCLEKGLNALVLYLGLAEEVLQIKNPLKPDVLEILEEVVKRECESKAPVSAVDESFWSKLRLLTKLTESSVLIQFLGQMSSQDPKNSLSLKSEFSEFLKQVMKERKNHSATGNDSQAEAILHIGHQTMSELKQAYVLSQTQNVPEEISRVLRELVSVPIEGEFNKFTPMIEDISRRMGKAVRYQYQANGCFIEHDKWTMLFDALSHLIRNALDHGIESEEVRLKEGKNKEGNISVSARETAQYLEIELADDGQGIDLGKVTDTAIKQKIKTKEEIENMSRPELLELIFLNGLSTKEDVSEISGRGVGADVAKQNVTDLGGRIDTFTEKGKGTRFVLYIPKINEVARQKLKK